MLEYAAHLHVGGSQCFQDANHVDALEHDDEQAGNDGESSYCHHQNEYHHDIHVEHVEPCEDMGCDVADAECATHSSDAVGCVVHLLDELGNDGINLSEIPHFYFESGGLVFLPSVELADGANIGEAHHLVVFCKVGFVDSLDDESTCTYVSIDKEIGKDLVFIL